MCHHCTFESILSIIFKFCHLLSVLQLLWAKYIEKFVITQQPLMLHKKSKFLHILSVELLRSLYLINFGHNFLLKWLQFKVLKENKIFCILSNFNLLVRDSCNLYKLDIFESIQNLWYNIYQNKIKLTRHHCA